jgi:hypothetical protein
MVAAALGTATGSPWNYGISLVLHLRNPDLAQRARVLVCLVFER